MITHNIPQYEHPHVHPANMEFMKSEFRPVKTSQFRKLRGTPHSVATARGSNPTRAGLPYLNLYRVYDSLWSLKLLPAHEFATN